VTKYPFVHVVWNDANSPGAAMAFEPEEAPHAPVVVETWGFALKHDVAGITVANELYDDGRYRGLTFIPAPMLVEITRLSLQTRKARRKSVPPVAVVDSSDLGQTGI
jgi:hypothetical protein